MVLARILHYPKVFDLYRVEYVADTQAMAVVVALAFVVCCCRFALVVLRGVLRTPCLEDSRQCHKWYFSRIFEKMVKI